MATETKTIARAEDFEAGELVVWVPEQAKGNVNHPDCERGRVTSTTSKYVFVCFNGSTSQACNPAQLV